MKYPFTPELLDALPEELAELFRSLEMFLLEEICSRLKLSDQLNQVTVEDIRALRAQGIDLAEIEQAIRKYTQISDEKLDSLFADVVAWNQAYYAAVVDMAGLTKPARMVNEGDVETIRRQTKDEFHNITQSMGFQVIRGGKKVLLPPGQAYQWALDSAELQVQSGAVSYNQAISDAVKQLADSGVCVYHDDEGNLVKNIVQYAKKRPNKPGHKDQLDVAVRRAVMTGVNQLNQKYREQAMEYLQTDLVEVTAHRGARDVDGPHGWENHKRWQGKVYRWK